MKNIIENFKTQFDLFEERLLSFSERERKGRKVDDIISEDYSLKDFEEQFEYIRKISKNLLKNHKMFFNIVSKNDINTLMNHFANLSSYLSNSNYSSIITYLNYIKEIFGKYNVSIVSKNEYVFDFLEEIGKLQQISRDLEIKMHEIQKDLNHKNEIIENIDDLREIYDELESKIQEITNNHLSSIELLNEINDSKDIFDGFIGKINHINEDIEKQKVFFKDSEVKINGLANQLILKLRNSKELIKASKQALNYTTAEGISAAIQSQYDEAKDSSLTSWLIGSIIFLIFALIIGLFTLFPITINLYFFTISNNAEITLYSFISRFGLIALLISASVFCAKQYTKQKNIIEDYAYKLVLAKSIIGFSEELKKGGEEGYQKYITKTLDELLQDPLRNKNLNIKDDKGSLSQLKEGVGIMKDMKDLLK